MLFLRANMPQEQKQNPLFVFPFFYDRIGGMNIPIADIYEFHRVRTACHIACMNYFAGLLGYHFPEHDNDKGIEPMRTGYAYKNYANYHPDYNLPDNYEELAKIAISTHHEHASHHVDFYNGDVSQIPDIHVIEMVADWASANFEQLYVLRDCPYNTVLEWFNAVMGNKNWTETQLNMIHTAMKTIEEKMDKDAVMKIWKPTLAISAL